MVVDRFFTVYVGLIGVAIAIIISNSISQLQNQIFIRDSIEKQTGIINDIIQRNNIRGNITAEYFKFLFYQLTNSEHNILGNLSDHRKITNISRDTQLDLLHQILNQTKP